MRKERGDLSLFQDIGTKGGALPSDPPEQGILLSISEIMIAKQSR